MGALSHEESAVAIGHLLWKRNQGRLWANIDSTERVFMAYARPGLCWAASDEALQPFSMRGQHRAPRA
jgi:hypothetical protein